MHRHEAVHLPAALVAAEDARQASSADSLLRDTLAMQAKALDLMDRAEADGDFRGAIVALREARECVELRARLAAELRESDPAPPQSLRVTYVRPRDFVATG